VVARDVGVHHQAAALLWLEQGIHGGQQFFFVGAVRHGLAEAEVAEDRVRARKGAGLDLDRHFHFDDLSLVNDLGLDDRGLSFADYYGYGHLHLQGLTLAGDEDEGHG
jgi:hypothetical protein